MRKILSALIIILLISGGIYWLQPDTLNNPQQGTSIVSDVINFFPNLIKSHRLHRNIIEASDGSGFERTEYTSDYEISATYPKTDDEMLNQLIEERIEKEINEFNEYVKDFNADDKKASLVLNLSHSQAMHLDSIFIQKDFTNIDDMSMLKRIDSFIYSRENKVAFLPTELFDSQKLNELIRTENKMLQEQAVNKKVIDPNENYTAMRLTENGVSVSMPSFKAQSSDSFFSVSLSMEKLEKIWDFTNPQFPADTRTFIEQEREARIAEAKRLEALRNQKIIAFTFDDGPSAETTNELLDILKENNVKATFFILGNAVGGNEEILKREYNEGHQLANHSVTHRELTKLSDTEIADEINNLNDRIESITGKRPTLCRPPYGSSNEHVRSIINMPIILWSVDTLDWKTRNTDMVVAEIKKSARDGAIVLMHDIHAPTIAAVKQAIPMLKDEGYVFVTVDELFSRRGIELKPGQIYFSAPKN